MRRWVCPTCGKGKIAPARPAIDDTRRFCLPCSETTGRLVSRHCPSLEREQRERRARAEKANAATAEAAATAVLPLPGTDRENVLKVTRCPERAEVATAVGTQNRRCRRPEGHSGACQFMTPAASRHHRPLDLD